MYQTVEVRKNHHDGTVEVACPESACQGCKNAQLCNVKDQSFDIKVEGTNKKTIAKGDEVKIFLPPGKTIGNTFLTLMVPLLCFPLFYLIFPIASEGLRFLIGFAGVFVGFGFVALFFKAKKKELYPEVVSVTKKEDLPQDSDDQKEAL